MVLPTPRPGLVINYAYLWRREADRGQEEGRKYRPSAVVIVSKGGLVAVSPITHSPPPRGSTAIELPQDVKDRIGLDSSRSWLITNEINVFTWPGHDLGQIDQTEPKRVAYGQLPPNLTRLLIERVRTHARERVLAQVDRGAGRSR